MSFKVTWSKQLTAAADDAANKAAKQTFTQLNAEFQKAITAKRWPWPNPPSPRDIVDTGSLRQSNTFSVAGTSAVFRWTKDYASFVHEGGIDGGRQNFPPRPWTDAVLYGENGFQKYDVAGEFKAAWIRNFNGKR